MLGQLQEGNKVAANKKAELQATTKDPKKVEAGKRLAEYNYRKREELARTKAQKSKNEAKLTYYDTGAVITIRFLGVISYYIHQCKTSKGTHVHQTKETPANKFVMD